MTETILRSLARRPPSALARPFAVAVYAVVLSLGGVLWLKLVHELQGSHAPGDTGFALELGRDVLLALPLQFAWIWIAVLLTRRALQRSGEQSPALSAAVLAVVVALVASLALALGAPLHAAIFGAIPAPSHEMPALLHLFWETVVGLVATLPLAAIATGFLLRRRPWDAPDTRRWLALAPSAQRLRLATLLLVLVLAPAATFAGSGVDGATADLSPGSPCPGGAPTKTYDVRAIDVDIPLNRFGDHDPNGKMFVLSDRVGDVREQEASQHVSIGLRDDPIQALVIRANLGDCVEIEFTNDASGGEYGVHIDGLSFDMGSSGDAVGNNAPSSAARGESRTYRYYIPEEPELEGAHYMRPGPGNRQAVAHGLFGTLLVEPQGSEYLDMDTAEPIESGWEAMIVPGDGKKAFREYALIQHEIGDESADVMDRADEPLPVVDPLTDGYRPGSRAMNYRSEPFMRRLERNGRMKSNAYGSYAFGDPATPMPRSYQGDPTKMRILHGGSETFHVYHLHGGAIRWRFNPHADTTFDYQDTGLNKHPAVAQSPSSRLDSQSTGPGQSFDLQVENGAGGGQAAAGEFLFHCHIAEHYVAGMWSFWRVFDTLQPHLAPLPDREPPPSPVDSTELIGKTMPDGTTLTKDNLDAWIRPQIPPQGVPSGEQDATVWNWQIDEQDPDKPLYLGEPEDKRAWANLTNELDEQKLPGHPGLFAGDQPVGPQDRPKILFNPENGRPAFPLLRPQIGDRPPFSPNGHSGAPYLGEQGDQAKQGDGPDPWANRADGICPAGAPGRNFNVVALDVSVPITRNVRDPGGKIFVLAKDADDVAAGRKPAEPLAIRGNQGDCVSVTLTSRQRDENASDRFAKVNMHIHHVQFDTQASDGVVSGMSYEQSVRPFAIEDPRLAAPANAGATTLSLTDVSKFQPGVFIGVGLGTEQIEVREIASIDAAQNQLTLSRPLENSHASGSAAGVEFAQYRWYPDAMLDNVFWHDHVDGIHGWGHGLVGQFIVEPPGSTYHDPRTGAQIESGALADIRTNNPMAAASGVGGSFREMVTWTIDENPITDSTINLRAEPFADRYARNNDPSLLFSSWTHGDPVTPLPLAYANDPFVIRSVAVGPDAETFHVDGHRFNLETRWPKSTSLSTMTYGVSERQSLILEGGAGGPQGRPGDYLYMNGVGRRFRQGAWGMIRVLGKQVPQLQPLPGTSVPLGGSPLPTPTGGRPPASPAAGNPCPNGAPERHFKIAAVDRPVGSPLGTLAAFVPTSDAAAVESGQLRPEPLVMHAAAGECIVAELTNRRSIRASLHADELVRSQESSGVNVGYGPEQTAAPGQSRVYRYFADTRDIGSAQLSDYGDVDSGRDGLYGAIVVADRGAKFYDTRSGAPTSVGSQVDVHLPNGDAYRDFTLQMADDDPVIGGSNMPYPSAVDGPALVNHRSARRPDSPTQFSSAVRGDPATPLLRAHAGDKVRVHALGAPGNEQIHVLSMGGQPFAIDPLIARSNEVGSHVVGPRQSLDFELQGGAGGRNHATGDFFYGDLRRAFTEAGMWGLMRVTPDAGCDPMPLYDDRCPRPPAPPEDLVPEGGSDAGSGAGADGGAVAQAPGAQAQPLAKQPAANETATAVPKPSGLRVAKRVKASKLADPGIRLRFRAPVGSRVVRLRLLRLGPDDVANVVATRVVAVKAGSVKIDWRLRPRELRRLRGGRYLIELRAGKRSSALWAARLERPIVVLGPVAGPAARR